MTERSTREHIMLTLLRGHGDSATIDALRELADEIDRQA